MAGVQDNHESLIAAATAGDKAALQQLMLAHFSIIEAAVKSNFPAALAGQIDPVDIIQDVLVDVHRGISDYQPSHAGGFVAWLRRIVENRTVSTIRHYTRHKRGGGVRQMHLPHGQNESLDTVWEWVFEDSNPPDRPVRREESRQALQVCLAELNEDQREAVTAYYFEHLDAGEIAKRMNRTPAAVRELLRRARKRLEELLGTASIWISSR